MQQKRRSKMRYWGIVAVLLCLIGTLEAQNLETIGQEKLKLSGGFGVDQNLYFADGIDDRFNPYTYVVRGNVTASMYGFSVPVTFTYSNQNFTKSIIPFNIVGLSPTYKAWTLHAGYRNLSFSKYTLAGHNFLGTGLEYKKDKWHFAVMGGRMLKAVEYDSISGDLPSFERRGYGIKGTYSDKGDEITFSTFYAKDDASSVGAYPALLGVRPKENQIYSLGFKKKLNDLVSIHFEGARSGLVDNNLGETIDGEYSGGDNLYFLAKNKEVIFNNAFNGGIDLKMGKAKIGAQFERVEPDYQTLGAYMINSDFQNVTASASRPFYKKKGTLSLRAGLQRDDLNGDKLSKMRRFVGSATVTMQVTKKLNSSFTYSNFNSIINIKPVDQAFAQNSEFDRIDTLNFAQVNQTLNATLNYKPLESTNVLHNITWNGNYNHSSNETSGDDIVNSIASTMVGYTINFKKKGASIGTNINANRSDFALGNSVFAGVGLNGSIRALKKKMKIRLNLRASNNYENALLTARLYAVTHAYSYKISKKQSLSLVLRASRRESISNAELSYFKSSFSEFIGSLGYSYRF